MHNYTAKHTDQQRAYIPIKKPPRGGLFTLETIHQSNFDHRIKLKVI